MARVTVPNEIRSLLFDVDGVLTDTATAHAAAWKRTFDEVLELIASEGVRRYADAEREPPSHPLHREPGCQYAT